MKMIMLATFLLLIQVSAGILNAIGFTQGYGINPDQETFNALEKNVKDQSYLQNLAVEDTSISFGFGDFFRGIWIFVNTVFWAVVNVRGTIETLMCGNTSCSSTISDIARYISYIVYFIWGLALAQFISNRASKGMA